MNPKDGRSQECMCTLYTAQQHIFTVLRPRKALLGWCGWRLSKVSQSKSTVAFPSGPPLTCINYPQVLVTSEDLMCVSLPTVVKAEWLECRKTAKWAGTAWGRYGGGRSVWLQVAQLNFLQFKVQDCNTLTDYSPLGPTFRIQLLPPSSGQNTEVAHHPKGWHLSTPIQLTAVL